MAAGFWNRIILAGLGLAFAAGFMAAQREPRPGEALRTGTWPASARWA